MLRATGVSQSFDDRVFRELSLDVRLAGGVHKRMTFALTTPTGEIAWLAVDRLTP